MAKSYFSHDHNARNDLKILTLRAKYKHKGYGVFWMLTEIMAESSEGKIYLKDIPAIALSLNLRPAWLHSFVAFCSNTVSLFEATPKYITHKRILENKRILDFYREKGLEGAKKRWGSDSLPSSPPNGSPNANKRKGNKRKVYIDKKDSAFKPPTLEQVSEYIKEKNLSVSGKEFIDYFTEGKWTDSRGNKVKNWKQKLLTWNKYKTPGAAQGGKQWQTSL